MKGGSFPFRLFPSEFSITRRCSVCSLNHSVRDYLGPLRSEQGNKEVGVAGRLSFYGCVRAGIVSRLLFPPGPQVSFLVESQGQKRNRKCQGILSLSPYFSYGVSIIFAADCFGPCSFPLGFVLPFVFVPLPVSGRSHIFPRRYETT